MYVSKDDGMIGGQAKLVLNFQNKMIDFVYF